MNERRTTSATLVCRLTARRSLFRRTVITLIPVCLHRLASQSSEIAFPPRLMSDGSERAAGPVVVLPRPPDGASLSWGETQAGRRKGEQGGHVFPGHEVLQSLTQG